MTKNTLLIALSLVFMTAAQAAHEHHTAPYPTTGSVTERATSPSTVTHTHPNQPETDADRQISLRIRKVLMDDNTLSANAKNIKVLTANGLVTLRGPVNSKEEKSIVVAKAKQIAGSSNVDYFIDVLR